MIHDSNKYNFHYKDMVYRRARYMFISCIYTTSFTVKYMGKIEPLQKAQHNKTEIVADSVRLSLFMDGSGNCKLPPMLLAPSKT